jgi:hypothetical protein
MRRLLTISALATVCASLALAETWTGKLIDYSCYQDKKETAACEPSSSTTMFALGVSGKVYKLDDSGNSKAAEALKSRADRSTGGGTSAKAITAKVTGTKDSDNTITVESIDVR